MCSILIADDEKIVRDGLAACISRMPRFELCGVAGDGDEALETARLERPDIILTDINMPHMNGLDFIARLRQTDAETVIIVISGYDHFAYAQSACQLGARDYLLKPVEADKLERALNRAAGEIEARNEQSLLMASVKDMIEKQPQRMRTHFLYRLLSAPIEEEYCAALLKAMGVEWRARYFVAGVLRGKSAAGERSPGPSSAIRLWLLPEDQGYNPALLMSESHVTLQAFEADARSCLERLCEVVAAPGEPGPAYTLGSAVASCTDISRSYAEAVQLMAESRPEGTAGGVGGNELGRLCAERIHERYSQPSLCVSELAKELYVSTNYLRTLFKQYTGQTFVKYLTSLRMEKAAELLKTTVQPVQEVARSVSYEDARYFSGCFKRYFGVNPSQCRER